MRIGRITQANSREFLSVLQPILTQPMNLLTDGTANADYRNLDYVSEFNLMSWGSRGFKIYATHPMKTFDFPDGVRIHID